MKEVFEEYGYALIAGVMGIVVVGILIFLLKETNGLQGLALAFSKSIGG